MTPVSSYGRLNTAVAVEKRVYSFSAMLKVPNGTSSFSIIHAHIATDLCLSWHEALGFRAS